MRLDSLALLYASKTDDELLALAAELDSLADEARPVLADELQRRNLRLLEPGAVRVEHHAPPTPIIEMFRTAGTFVAHLIAALLGTGIVESSIWAILGRPQSLPGLEAKIWFTNVTIAALVGFLVSRYKPGKSALWVWTLPVVLLALRALLYWRGKFSVAEHFLAPNCLDDKSECQDFLVFTVSATRTLAYSLGAWASMRFEKRRKRADVAAV